MLMNTHYFTHFMVSISLFFRQRILAGLGRNLHHHKCQILCIENSFGIPWQWQDRCYLWQFLLEGQCEILRYFEQLIVFFLIGNMCINFQTFYKLGISGFRGGVAGDGLKAHNNMNFTTKDRDQDMANSTNCAMHARGAWW